MAADIVIIATKCAIIIWKRKPKAINPGPIANPRVSSTSRMSAEVAVGKYTIGNTVAFDSEGIVSADAIAPTAAKSKVPIMKVPSTRNMFAENENDRRTNERDTKTGTNSRATVNGANGYFPKPRRF